MIDRFRIARRWIKKGWLKGHLFEIGDAAGGFGVCAQGAVIFSLRQVRKLFVAGKFVEEDLRRQPHCMHDALHAAIPDGKHAAECSPDAAGVKAILCVENFNDRIAKNKEEVITLFDRAIVLLEGRKHADAPLQIEAAKSKEAELCRSI